MTLHELTKKYGEGKGEDTMWSTIEIVSDAIEKSMDADAKDELLRSIYGMMSDGHYNEEYAREDIADMYYTDSRGNEHHAPYWTDEQLMDLYDEYKREIPDYNCWDWAVAVTMVKSTYCHLLNDWFPDADEKEKNEKIAELAVHWLKDESTSSKIWDEAK